MHEHHARRHILFVDDDTASQRMVERVLRAGVPDARVTCASDGVQALQVLDRESIDLLITDLSMPGMDGIELLRRVAMRRVVLPVIVVTGHGSPTHHTRALADGAFEYFEKPISAEPFVQCVQELLDGTSRRSRIEGVSIAGFVQLLGMERKTCALRASIGDAQGVLYFDAGVLVDARQAGLCGAEAALEIFTWRDPVITLEGQTRARAPTIRVSVTELLLESARLADERERNLRRSAQGRAGGRSESVPAAPPVTAGGGRGPALSLVPAVATPPPSRPPPTTPAPRAPPTADASIVELLAEALKIDGVTAAAVADWELDDSFRVPGATSESRSDAAAVANCRVMRAVMSGMQRLGLDSRVQDVLITLDEQSHILWPLPQHEGLFLYLVVERSRGNLALTRHRLQKIVAAQEL